MANRFWVGGTGTWDASNTTNWSATTGGAGGASVPTVADAAIFNASSGGGTVTLGANVDCQTVNFSGFTGTFNFSTYDVNVAGNAATVVNVTSTIAAINGTGKFNCSYAGGTGTRTVILTGGTAAKAANLRVSAGTDTLTLSSTNHIIDLDFTGFAGTWTTTTTVNVYGNLTLSTGMTVGTLAAAIVMGATTTGKTITSNGKTIDIGVTFNGVGGGWTLQDALTLGATRTLILTTGALSLGNNNLTCGIFSGSNSNARSISTTGGQIYCVSNNATIFNASTATNLTITGNLIVNCTYSGGTGTRQVNGGATATLPEAQSINFNITAGTDTFSFGGSNCAKNVDFTGFKGVVNSSSATAVTIYGNLTFDSGCNPSFAGGTTLTFGSTSGTNTITCAGTTIGTNIAFTGLGGTWQFADALTLASPRTINFTNGTLRLKSGVTSTVYGFTSSGIAQKNLQSTTLGSQATLSDPSGTVSTNYLTIRDINATGGATWNAFVDQGNIDAGNNDGWDFGISPIVGGNEYTYQLRSFTQPRRF